MEDKEGKKEQELKIMEWRYSQFLGEKLSYDQIKNDPENESFLVTNCKFSSDGSVIAVSDKGGRVILFKKNESKINKLPKLDYFYEYAAQEKEFDVHISVEHNEEVKAMTILPISCYNKVDIMTANSRSIKLDRIYKEKIKIYDNTRGLNVPKISNIKTEIKHKTKKLFKFVHHHTINTIAENKINTWNFMSSDEFKIFLWDLNCHDKVYNLVDIDPCMEIENPEKITKSVFCDYNPSLFSYGTNKGNIKICDLRTSSDHLLFSSRFNDENSNLNKTVFANSLLSVHDINMSMSNSYSFATRHFLSVNLWDMRKCSEPSTKFLLFEPIINKLSYLYQNNYLEDKFSLSTDKDGKYILTGGYNNMFHVIDIEQRLNTQVIIDDMNEKVLNTNIIRKINNKGSCFYKKDDPTLNNINFDKKILNQAFSPVDNYTLMIVYNCIYSYNGNITKKDNSAKK